MNGSETTRSTGSAKLILGSRSPRRRQLLEQLAPGAEIESLPPRDAEEPEFDGARDVASIERQLHGIARAKADDVLGQLRVRDALQSRKPWGVVIAADTIIVVADPSGHPLVIGQPPADETWKDVVRTWFRTYYAGRTHRAMTALCVAAPDGRVIERLVTTRVTFVADVERHLDWYFSTGEPRGKAGGYGLQGAGSVFIERVEGSLSNVIGLPLEAVLEAFEELGMCLTHYGKS